MKFNEQDQKDIARALELWKQDQIKEAGEMGFKGLAPVLFVDLRRQVLLRKIGINEALEKNTS